MKTDTSLATQQATHPVKRFLTNNMVTIMFVVLSIAGLIASGMSAPLYISDIIHRVTRNSFLVLSLVIPVMAGMGLNFSIVLGALAAQSVIIFVTHWGVAGIQGIVLCFALSLPLAIILGYFTGKLFNRAKGQEMITGIILGFFAAGIYMFVFLQLVGGVIPMDNQTLVLSQGVGIRTTIDLSGGLRYALDDFFRLPLTTVMIMAGIIGILYQGISFRSSKNRLRFAFGSIVSLAAIGAAIGIMNSTSILRIIQVPFATWLTILGLCGFLFFFTKTKLGQDMRSVGQNRHVAEVSGIAVDRVRVIAIIMSTVMAAWGHIVFLQNMGAWSTYGSHEQIGFYSVAALLIGGATVAKATVGQALLGVFLFHTLFIVAPASGRELFGDAQIGEYFRVFVVYGVIGAALAMHAWKTRLQSKQKLNA